MECMELPWRLQESIVERKAKGQRSGMLPSIRWNQVGGAKGFGTCVALFFLIGISAFGIGFSAKASLDECHELFTGELANG